jgi:hypothetical protein
VENDGGTLTLSDSTKTLMPVLSEGRLRVELAVGNLDYDSGEELGAVLNEGPVDGNSGASSYFLFDDAGANHTELASGLVRGEVELDVLTAEVADVAFGDIDGDHLDEVLLAGLTELDTSTSRQAWPQIHLALDDALRDFAPLGAHVTEQRIQGLSESGQSLTYTFVHVNTLDIDGDGRDEVAVNDVIFEDWVGGEEPGPWQLAAELDESRVLHSGGRQKFLHDTTAATTGDFNQDGREDLALYSQDLFHTHVFGWSPETQAIAHLSTLDMSGPGSDTPQRPILLAPNVDDDSIGLRWDREHRYVFTEPVVIAALAAAPCNESWGQNLQSCVTAFGKAKSNAVSEQTETTLTAGSSVGFSAGFNVAGVEVASTELVASVSTAVSNAVGTSRTVTTKVEHETGPVEDSVLFTTVPADQYIYTVTSHPTPELVGETLVVTLPRRPITVLVSRDFYNRAVNEQAVRVDETVFTHTAGDPTSYPSPAERDELLARFEGLQTDQADVGQGTGTTRVELNVTTEQSSTNSLSVDYTVDARVTGGGVISGFSVGAGMGRSLSVTKGMESAYTGSVGNLDEASFVENGYAFGLFAYVYEDPASGRQFEVLHYWVR